MWSFLLMSTLITLVGVSLLVAFVVFHPKKPTYALEEVRVEVRTVIRSPCLN